MADEFGTDGHLLTPNHFTVNGHFEVVRLR